MAKRSVRDLDVAGKRVFMRVDYNVPMEEKDGVMVINDVTRIKETLPTLQLLASKGARIILAAHLGRPDGKREPSMSLRPRHSPGRRWRRRLQRWPGQRPRQPEVSSSSCPGCSSGPSVLRAGP